MVDECCEKYNISSAPVQQCYQSLAGDQMLFDAGRRTAALRPRLTFVPWILIDAQRDASAYTNLKAAVCSAIASGDRPGYCHV